MRGNDRLKQAESSIILTPPLPLVSSPHPPTSPISPPPTYLFPPSCLHKTKTQVRKRGRASSLIPRQVTVGRKCVRIFVERHAPSFLLLFFLMSQMRDFSLTVACGNCWVPKLIEKNYNYCTVLYVLHWCFKVLLRFSIFASLIFVHSLYRHTYIHISKPTNKPVLIWLSLP